MCLVIASRINSLTPTRQLTVTKLEDFLPFVKGQIRYNERRLKNIKGNSGVYTNCKGVLDNLKRLETFIETHKNSNNSVSQETKNKPAAPKLTLSPADLEGLPDELLAQLAISSSDKADFEILSIFEQLGGIASLDQVIIALYKKTGEIPERAKINAKIYRISQKGLLEPVEGKKAVYRVSDQKSSQAELFM
jgi:hypothetical protein